MAWKQVNQTAVSSGLVTFNCGNGELIVKHRESQARNGAALFAPNVTHGVDTKAFMHIATWQLMLGHRDPAVGQRNVLFSRGTRPAPFVSFNQFKPMSMEEAESQLEALGFAGGDHTYSEISQPNVGIASVVSGSFSTRNTGVSTWGVNTLLQWKAYPMRDTDEDKAELQKFLDLRARAGAISPEQPRGSFPVRIEAFNFDRDVRNRAALMMKAVFDRYPAGHAKLLNFSRLDNREPMGADEHFFMTRVRGDLALCLKFAALGGAGGLEDAAVRLGFGSGVAGVGASSDVPGVFAMLRTLYAAEMGELTERTTAFGELSATMTAEFRMAPTNAFDAHCQAIHEGTRRIVARSLGVAGPGENGLVVC